MEFAASRRLYVAEFKNGVIKLGITGQAGERRTKDLLLDGKRPIRHRYFDLHECGFWAEREMIVRLRALANVFRGREWFTGIRFGAAAHLAAQITRRAVAIDAERRAA